MFLKPCKLASPYEVYAPMDLTIDQSAVCLLYNTCVLTSRKEAGKVGEEDQKDKVCMKMPQ